MVCRLVPSVRGFPRSNLRQLRHLIFIPRPQTGARAAGELRLRHLQRNFCSSAYFLLFPHSQKTTSYPLRSTSEIKSTRVSFRKFETTRNRRKKNLTHNLFNEQHREKARGRKEAAFKRFLFYVFKRRLNRKQTCVCVNVRVCFRAAESGRIETGVACVCCPWF